MKTIYGFLFPYSFFLILFACCVQVQARTFPLPAEGDVVGQLEVAVVKSGDSFAQIARDHDLGYTELQEANPEVDPDHIPTGTVLVIPNQFILPNAPRKGVVINLAEMRLYFYPGAGSVITHPLGIGREGEDTPVGVMKVIEHIPNPTWTATQTMRKLRAQEGIILPKSVPPGPDNPLGKFAMRLSSPTYLIHGTNDPLGGIGRRSSSGCMRLYPEDIETLYHQVKNGTPVYMVNQPYKVGWSENQLYIESHAALDESIEQGKSDVDAIKAVISQRVSNKQAQVDWDKAVVIAGETQGWPQLIGGLPRNTD
ncbi:MAG TPA: L,D-transpeptidase family protein [Gammaproteobacteria bacterium]|nr:L,D-transpeptidase family protein [Gammaproteobacteria bacterium]